MIRLACTLAFIAASAPSLASADPTLAAPAAQHAYVQADPVPTPAPPPDEVASGDAWYGHWHLLSGSVLAGLYTMAAYGTHHTQGDDKIGAGIGSGYLLMGFTMTGAGIHLAYDNEVAAAISGVSRLLFGIAAPSITSLVCDEADACDVALAIATGVSTAVPVAVDSFVLAWD